MREGGESNEKGNCEVASWHDSFLGFFRSA